MAGRRIRRKVFSKALVLSIYILRIEDMNGLMTKLAYPALQAANIVLFACFVPKGRKLNFWEKPFYRQLVKLVVLEHRMMLKAQKRLAAC